ncbi:hypothetical protein C8Q79DRAFT_926176 [Trametes meyenii]|nr:hypothetical protein C8Q79DRAFT_926176 [Trametes meyenii]
MPRTRGAVKPPVGGPALALAPVPERATSSSMVTKRPLARRAASAAPALPPTPPQTTHKRKRRSRSRVTDSSSEEEDHEVPVVDSDDEDGSGEPQRKVGALVIGHKKRRTLTLDAIAEELSEAKTEDAFWLGDGAQAFYGRPAADSSASQSRPKVIKNRAPTRARSRTRSPSSSPPPAPHLLRRGHTGLFSPPPSRRAPAVVPRPATPPPEPKPSKQKGKGLPERDSPNNPFLADDSPGSVPPSEIFTSPEPHTPKKQAEKPTVTYVFRGVRTVLANPHYRSPEAAAEVAEAEARARLPAEHPDFSPSEACAPTLLFPEARKHEHARRRAHGVVPAPTSPTPKASKRSMGDLSSDEELGGKIASKGKAAAPGPSTIIPEVEDADAMSAALASRVAKRMRKGIYADGEAPRTRPSSTAGDLPQLPEKDRSDPIKRAMGPVRPA